MSDILDRCPRSRSPAPRPPRTRRFGRPVRSWSMPVRSPRPTWTRCSTGRSRSPPTWATSWPSRTAPTRPRTPSRRRRCPWSGTTPPIDWDGNEVRFAVGIAGLNNGHLEILGKIAVIFSDMDEVDKMIAAGSANEVYDLLNAVNEE